MILDAIARALGWAANREQMHPKGWNLHFMQTISDMIRKNESGTSRFVPESCASVKEGAMHDSRTVANRFLELAAEEGKTLTPMQLLKLVYIAHGWKLGLAGEPLIRDDIQAWQYGPVIPRLYDSIRRFRDRPVVGPLQTSRDAGLTNAEANLIRQVYKIYGDRSGPELSRLTHAAGTPWAKSYRDRSFGIPISNDTIEDHYRQLARERA